jgi:hypothetical protein
MSFSKPNYWHVDYITWQQNKDGVNTLFKINYINDRGKPLNIYMDSRNLDTFSQDLTVLDTNEDTNNLLNTILKIQRESINIKTLSSEDIRKQYYLTSTLMKLWRIKYNKLLTIIKKYPPIIYNLLNCEVAPFLNWSYILNNPIPRWYVYILNFSIHKVGRYAELIPIVPWNYNHLSFSNSLSKKYVNENFHLPFNYEILKMNPSINYYEGDIDEWSDEE